MADSEKKFVNMISSSLIEGVKEINTLKIHYVRSGKGQPLLLIHGLNIGWGQWYANVQIFEKEYTVTAIDLPGAGSSTRIDFYKTAVENLYPDVIEKFIGERAAPINILGHSLGGWLALKLVLRKRINVNKTVLVQPMGFTNYLPLNKSLVSIRLLSMLISRTVFRPTEKNIKNFFLEVMKNKQVIQDEFIDYYSESINRRPVSHPLSLMNSLTKFFKIKKEFVFTDEELRNIQRQILIIMGDSDPLIPLNKVLNKMRLLPNANIKVLEGTGHVPFIERSHDFNQLVLGFFK